MDALRMREYPDYRPDRRDAEIDRLHERLNACIEGNAMTEPQTDHHDLAWANGSVACNHDNIRDGCPGCVHDAAIERQAADAALAALAETVAGLRWWDMRTDRYVLAAEELDLAIATARKETT